jgi:hypothetical protein
LNKEDDMDNIEKEAEMWKGAVTIEKSHPLFGAARFVCAAVSKDKHRQQMLGVFVRRVDGEMKLVSTDGRRLHIAVLPEPSDEVGFPPDGAIMKVVTNTATKVVFAGAIEGRFADYERVIPAIDKAETLFLADSLTETAFAFAFSGVKVNLEYLKPLEGREWVAYVNAPDKAVVIVEKPRPSSGHAKLTAVIMPMSWETPEQTAAAAEAFQLRRSKTEAKPEPEPEAETEVLDVMEPEAVDVIADEAEAEAAEAAEEVTTEARTKAERVEYAKARKAAIKAENEALIEAAIPGGIPTAGLSAACTAVNAFSPMAKYASPVNFLTAVLNGTTDARTFKAWMKAGRKVKKGAKAFYIDQPRIIGYRAKLDPETKEQIREPVVSSVPCAVFRVEDTEGKEIPYEPMGEAGLWALDAIKAMAEIAA